MVFILLPPLLYLIILFLLKTDKREQPVLVVADTGNEVIETSIPRKTISKIQYHILTSKSFLIFILNIFYAWVKSVVNLIIHLPRVILWIIFIYCIYDPSIITQFSLISAQAVFEFLANNAESVITIIFIISVYALIFCPPLNPAREMTLCRDRLICMYLQIEPDSYIHIRRKNKSGNKKQVK